MPAIEIATFGDDPTRTCEGNELKSLPFEVAGHSVPTLERHSELPASQQIEYAGAAVPTHDGHSGAL